MARTGRPRRDVEPFPVRGTPGGWRDPWDEPDGHAALRACAEERERRQLERAAELGQAWRQELADERRKRLPLPVAR